MNIKIIFLLILFINIIIPNIPSEPIKNNIIINDENNLNIQPGDILFRQIENTTITDHSLLYIDFNSNNKTYLFIEAKCFFGFDHVTKKEYSKDELLSGNFRKFARVKNINETQKQNAIDFAIFQLGKPFDHGFFHHDKNYNPYDIDDKNSSKWYCTELVWAAYYNCNYSPEKKIFGFGIDIDNNGWKKDSFGNSMVWPHNIILDDDTKIYYLREKITLDTIFTNYFEIINLI